MRRFIFPLLGIFTFGFIGGCETASPNSPAAQKAMRDEGKIVLEQMQTQDPSLTPLLNSSYGYAIFPSIGEGAIGIGGASGEGTVYQNGQRVGTLKMTQGSIGLQLGGQTFGELIIFQDDKAFNRITNDSLEFGADASAAFVKSGAAAGKSFANGVQVFVLPKGGLMAGVAVSGQKFHFYPDQVTPTDTTTATEKPVPAK